MHAAARKQQPRYAESNEVHTSGVHTLNKEVHTKALNHTHDPAPNTHLRCGAHLLLSPHLNGLRPGSLTLGGEEAQEK
jgi:hypothetical protein